MNIVHLINVRWFNATAWYALRLIESGILAGDRAAAAGLPPDRKSRILCIEEGD